MRLTDSEVTREGSGKEEKTLLTVFNTQTRTNGRRLTQPSIHRTFFPGRRVAGAFRPSEASTGGERREGRLRLIEKSLYK